MAKRSWLKPLSIVFAALASAAASASTKSTQEIIPPTTPLELQTVGSASAQGDHSQLQPDSQREFLFRQDGNLFKFILERTGLGDLILSHYSHHSHSSHSSHSSHESHSSHYSSRY